MKLLPLVILFKFFLQLEEVVLVGNKSRDKPVCITNLRNNPLNPINHPIFLFFGRLSLATTRESILALTRVV